MPTAQISPSTRTLPHTLYVRVPSYSNPRPRVTDLTEFEPSTDDRGRGFVAEAASFVHQYNRDLPKVAILTRRWIGYVNKRVETELFSTLSASGRRVNRGSSKSNPKGKLAPAALYFANRPEGNQQTTLTPVWMSLSRPVCPKRIYDLAYTYNLASGDGSKWTYTWRVSDESQYTLTLWAFQSERGDNSSEESLVRDDGELELEYLVASFHGGKMRNGEIEGVLEMEYRGEELDLSSYSGTRISTDEALVGLLEALRFELKQNKTSKRRV